MDPKRLEPFIKFIYEKHVMRTETGDVQRPKIFLYKVWSGLQRVVITSDGEIRYEDVVASAGGGGVLAQVAGGQKIRSLQAALDYIDQAMQRELAIFF